MVFSFYLKMTSTDGGPANGNEDYLDVNYWNSRYEQEAEFDWCKDYQLLKPLINKKVNRNDSILMLGMQAYFEIKKLLHLKSLKGFATVSRARFTFLTTRHVKCRT